MSIAFIDTAEHEWHLLPSLSLLLGRCEDPDCNPIHAVQIHAQWLCFGIMITFEL